MGTNALVWKTSYVYLGGRLLATTTGADGNETRFHHPDRLGTRLVTDAGGAVVSEQFTLPFGTMLPFTQNYGGETSYQNQDPGLSNPLKKRFTSYDRSEATNLDYAVNRHYSPAQGRFTQVDPIGMSAASLGNPQTLNLYAYCGNDPINNLDPDGLFFGKLFGWIGKIVKWVAIAVTVAVAVLTIIPAVWAGVALGKILVFLATHKTLAAIFGLSGLAGRFGTPSTFPGTSSGGGVGGFLPRRQDGSWGDKIRDIGIAMGRLALKGAKAIANLCQPPVLVGLDTDVSFVLGPRATNLFAPAVATSMSAAFRELNRAGIIPTINSGYRTEEDQQRMIAGASGANPAADLSLHQAGYAVDIDGTRGQNFPTIITTMEAHGFTWRGNFPTRPDPPHFQIDPFGTPGTPAHRQGLRTAADNAARWYENCTRN